MTDDTSEQDDIDAENIIDALLQRFATDPATPMSVLAQVMTSMGEEGLSLVQAMSKAAPQMVQTEQAAQPGAEELPAEPTIAPATAPRLPSAPLQQVFVRS